LLQYALSLHNDDEAWEILSQPEMLTQIQKHKAWKERPSVVGGAGSDRNTGRILRKIGSSVVTDDGPLKASTEVMGGYYTILATNSKDETQLTMGGECHDSLRHVLVIGNEPRLRLPRKDVCVTADKMRHHSACRVDGVFHFHVQFTSTLCATTGPGLPLRCPDCKDETRRNQ
jgi:hypothetical protein